jgi:hypothetical protein
LHFRKQLADSEWLNTRTGNYLENRKTDTNQQILYDGAALLGICDHHSFHGSNLVEAAADAK